MYSKIILYDVHGFLIFCFEKERPCYTKVYISVSYFTLIITTTKTTVTIIHVLQSVYQVN